jgi:hypothetical protein
MTLTEDINRWSRQLRNSIEIMEEILQRTNNIDDIPAEELCRCLSKIQDLCSDAALSNNSSRNTLNSIAARWGVTIFTRQSSESTAQRVTRLFEQGLQNNQTQVGGNTYNTVDYSVEKTRYSWPLHAGGDDNFQYFRVAATTYEKRVASEELGEIYGHQFVTEILRYETVLDPIVKFDSFKQGFDAVYRDSATGDLVIAEFKGQDSNESNAQKRITWSMNVCNQIINRQGVYARAGDGERMLAVEIRNQIIRGQVRYELIRTRFDERTGDLYSVVEHRRNLRSEG